MECRICEALLDEYNRAVVAYGRAEAELRECLVKAAIEMLQEAKSRVTAAKERCQEARGRFAAHVDTHRPAAGDESVGTGTRHGGA